MNDNMFVQSDFSDGWQSKSDHQLWAAFREGHRDAFSALFLRFYKKLFRYGMNFQPCQETVKDGIQQLFLQLWKKRKTLDTPESITSYLFVSLRRVLLRSKERHAARDRRNREFSQHASDSILSAERKIIVQEEKKERESLFQEALKSLTIRQKEALSLRLDSNLSNQEIADIMELSNKRVRNLIYEATKRLREQIYKLSN